MLAATTAATAGNPTTSSFLFAITMRISIKLPSSSLRMMSVLAAVWKSFIGCPLRDRRHGGIDACRGTQPAPHHVVGDELAMRFRRTRRADDGNADASRQHAVVG